MAFKINISDKTGKTYKLEQESEELVGKELHDKVQGKIISPDLNDYEFEITGASDNAGFTAMKEVEGIGLKKVLLGYGKAMKQRPRKEGKKKQSTPKPKGLRLRKTVRGKVISPAISQINLKIIKEGVKKLSEIFPDQNKTEQAQENSEEKKEETKSEPKQETPETKPETDKPTQKEPKQETQKSPEANNPKQQTSNSQDNNQNQLNEPKASKENKENKNG